MTKAEAKRIAKINVDYYKRYERMAAKEMAALMETMQYESEIDYDDDFQDAKALWATYDQSIRAWKAILRELR